MKTMTYTPFTIYDLKIGPCSINGFPAFIRKINSETKVICYHVGTHGMQCDKFEDFKSHVKSIEIYASR